MVDEPVKTLEQAIIEQMKTVIDPETGADVWRMRLVENLTVEADGQVTYRFRPSSPFCPIAVSLAQMIKSAVSQVPGVTGQTIQVAGYVRAELLTQLMNRDA